MAAHGRPVRHFAAMSQATHDLATLADRIDAAVASILTLRPALEAGAPWPLAAAYGVEPEANWGPAEVLAHLDEMLPYWLGEAERILDGDPSAPVPFGRIADDPIRIGVIGRDRTIPMRELLARLESEGSRVAARLRAMPDGAAGRVGLHPSRGEVTIAVLFERFAAGHLEDHADQLRVAIDAGLD